MKRASRLAKSPLPKKRSVGRARFATCCFLCVALACAPSSAVATEASAETEVAFVFVEKPAKVEGGSEGGQPAGPSSFVATGDGVVSAALVAVAATASLLACVTARRAFGAQSKWMESSCEELDRDA